jgi:hypothetical protein
MESVRLLQIGTLNSALLDNLASNLTSVQRHFAFNFDGTRNVIEVPRTMRLPDGSIPEARLEGIVRRHMEKLGVDEYPIALTSFPIAPKKDEIVWSNDRHLSIVSLDEWNTYCQCRIEQFASYCIAAALLCRNLDFEIHPVSRGCPNDFCEVRQDVNRGIKQGRLCSKCESVLQRAVEESRIAIAEAAAIKRMFDNVAGRRVCFVLMPFAPRFDKVYETIQRLVEAKGYECLRADQVFRATDIMYVVVEMIHRADVVIADVTGRNPNVFYELGYAHAIGKETVLLTQNEKDVPFDVRQRQFVLYRPGSRMKSQLRRIIDGYLSGF